MVILAVTATIIDLLHKVAQKAFTESFIILIFFYFFFLRY